MFCGKCGTENRDEVTFCIKCGADLKRQTISPSSGSVSGLKTSSQPSSSRDSLGDLDTSSKPDQDVEALEIGTLFANRYEILSEGKRGGMGIVYKVREIKLNQIRALKLIHSKLVDLPQALQRFRQEVDISLKLLHENIVRVYDLDEYKGVEFFTMEWVEGRSLREILNERKNRNSPFCLEEAFAILSQLSKALQFAHKKTIHRDIKPENIIISDEKGKMLVKLTDFGIAKMLGSGLTHGKEVMGTPDYMAPEQKKSAAQVDRRVDIYATGVVLFELLTLENSARLELPSELNKTLPKEIDDVVRKAIATRPDSRYGEIWEFAEAIRSIVVKRQENAEREKIKERAFQSHINQGKNLLRQSQFDEAISELRSALNLKPGSVEAKGLLNQAAEERESWVETKENKLRKERVLSHVTRGKSYLENGLYNKAVLELREALELDPDSREISDLYQKALNIKTEVEREKEKARMGSEIKGNLVQADTFIKDGLYSEAISELEKTLVLAPYNETARSLLKHVQNKVRKQQKKEIRSELLIKMLGSIFEDDKRLTLVISCVFGAVLGGGLGRLGGKLLGSILDAIFGIAKISTNFGDVFGSILMILGGIGGVVFMNRYKRQS